MLHHIRDLMAEMFIPGVDTRDQREIRRSGSSRCMRDKIRERSVLAIKYMVQIFITFLLIA